MFDQLLIISLIQNHEIHETSQVQVAGFSTSQFFASQLSLRVTFRDMLRPKVAAPPKRRGELRDWGASRHFDEHAQNVCILCMIIYGLSYVHICILDRWIVIDR